MGSTNQQESTENTLKGSQLSRNLSKNQFRSMSLIVSGYENSRN